MVVVDRLARRLAQRRRRMEQLQLASSLSWHVWRQAFRTFGARRFAGRPTSAGDNNKTFPFTKKSGPAVRPCALLGTLNLTAVAQPSAEPLGLALHSIFAAVEELGPLNLKISEH